MGNSTRHRWRGTGAVLVALAAVVLTGCSGTVPTGTATTASAGLTVDQAAERLRGVPGLSDTSVQVNTTRSGLQEHRRVWIEATTDRTARTEQAALLRSLVSLGWSIGSVDVDGGVSVRLHTTPQVVVGDLVDPSWEGVQYRSSPAAFAPLVVFPRSTLAEELGPWPGAAPDLSATG